MERSRAASLTTSQPRTRAVPAVGASKVARIRTSVVFPAPFGPSSPSTFPAGAVRDTPSSAVVAPNVRRNPLISMTVSDCATRALLRL